MKLNNKKALCFLSSLLLILFLSVSAVACGGGDGDTPEPDPKPNPNPNPEPYPDLGLPADDVIRSKAARLLMVGFRGSEITPDNPVNGYLKDLGVGAIVLFDVDLTTSAQLGSRNITSPEQLKKLTSDIQAISRNPILIAVDQEGGLVQRLKPAYGWEKLASAKEAGQGGEEAVRAQGALAARQLSEAGVNLNLAPVADLDYANCPAIGKIDRAYSANPAEVEKYCHIFMQEHAKQGIATTLKHFPGHGSAVNDTHRGFTDVTSTWHENELEPFKGLINSGDAEAIMTAHIFNKNLDPDYPASLSKKITTDLLREKLGFKGLIITDDLYMEAVKDNYPVEEFIVLAINSGADLLCIGNNLATGFEKDRPQLLTDIITKAVKRGKIPYQRILDANQHLDDMLAKLSAEKAVAKSAK